MRNDYIRGLQSNREIAAGYYMKSVVKTEQQKFLEKLLSESNFSASIIADIACGSGTLSNHLNELYPDAQFYLADLNPDALKLAREVCIGDNFHFSNDDIYDLKTLSSNFFDAIFCWQTLSWIDQPELALNRMIKLLKSGGKLYLSSLFNLEHDVDIYASVKDHTRQGDASYSYNTYSKKSVLGWLEDRVQKVSFYPFCPNIDLSYEGRGLGTYTIQTIESRLQVSGGMLLNWAILEIVK